MGKALSSAEKLPRYKHEGYPMKGKGGMCANISAKRYIEYCAEQGRPIASIDGVVCVWAGTHWRMIGKDELLIAADEVLSSDWETPQASLKNMQSFAELVTVFAPKVFPQAGREVKINFRNCTVAVDSVTGERQVRAHSLEDYLTYVLPYDYDPSATADTYKAALDEWLPGETEQLRLHQTIACALLGGTDVKVEKVLYLYGAGGTGKSTILEHFSKVFGSSNVSHVSLRALTSGPTGCYSAVGKVVNIDEECPSSLPDSSRFKSLVSRSPLEFRELYKNPVTTTRIPMLWFASNFRVNFNDLSGAIDRRLEVFEFRHKPKAIDRRLQTKLAEEVAGTMNIVIDALVSLIRNNYDIISTDEAIAQVEECRKSTDVVDDFLSDIGAMPATDETPRKYHVVAEALSAAMADWCKIHGRKMPASQLYGQGMRAHGYEKVRKTINGKKVTVWNLVATNIVRYLPDKLVGLAIDYNCFETENLECPF